MKILMMISFALLLIYAAAGSGAAQSTKIPILLPNSTVVAIKSGTFIDSNNVKVGQDFVFFVAADVVVRGVVLIAAGAPVIGVVEHAAETGMVGQEGQVTVTIQSTQAVDGTTVALNGALRAKGESEMGGTIAAGVILCPLFLLNKGGAAEIQPTAQARAFTIGSFKIQPLDEADERVLRERLDRERKEREERIKKELEERKKKEEEKEKAEETSV